MKEALKTLALVANGGGSGCIGGGSGDIIPDGNGITTDGITKMNKHPP